MLLNFSFYALKQALQVGFTESSLRGLPRALHRASSGKVFIEFFRFFPLQPSPGPNCTTLRSGERHHYRKWGEEKIEGARKHTTRTRYVRADVRCTGFWVRWLFPISPCSSPAYSGVLLNIPRANANTLECKHFPTSPALFTEPSGSLAVRFGYDGFTAARYRKGTVEMCNRHQKSEVFIEKFSKLCHCSISGIRASLFVSSWVDEALLSL